MDNPARSSLRNSGYRAEKLEQFRRAGPTPTHKRGKLFWTRSRKEALAAWLFILPDTIGLLIFLAIPMVLALSLGFFEVNGFGGYRFVGLANYNRMFRDPLFLESLWVTIVYVVCLVPDETSRSSFRVSRWMPTVSTAVLAIITASPLVWMLSASVKEPGEIFNSNLIPQHPTLDNYRYVFTQLPFLRYNLNTFFVAGTITVVALLLHSMAGFAFARLRFPGRETIFLAIFSTFLVSLQVIIVPLFILVQRMGMVNTYAGLIIPVTFNAFGIFLLRQFYLGIPIDLHEAAILDGASY